MTFSDTVACSALAFSISLFLASIVAVGSTVDPAEVGAVLSDSDGAVLSGSEGAVLSGSEGAVLSGSEGAVLSGSEGAVPVDSVGASHSSSMVAAPSVTALKQYSLVSGAPSLHQIIIGAIFYIENNIYLYLHIYVYLYIVLNLTFCRHILQSNLDPGSLLQS